MARCLLIFFILFSFAAKAQKSSTAKLGVALHPIQGLNIKGNHSTQFLAKQSNATNNIEVLSVGKHVVKVSATKFEGKSEELSQNNVQVLLSPNGKQKLITMLTLPTEVYASLLNEKETKHNMPIVIYTIEAY